MVELGLDLDAERSVVGRVSRLDELGPQIALVRLPVRRDERTWFHPRVFLGEGLLHGFSNQLAVGQGDEVRKAQAHRAPLDRKEVLRDTAHLLDLHVGAAGDLALVEPEHRAKVVADELEMGGGRSGSNGGIHPDCSGYAFPSSRNGPLRFPSHFPLLSPPLSFSA